MFEDNAEFAYGYFHAQDAIRKELLNRLADIRETGVAEPEIDAYLTGWNDMKNRARFRMR